MGAFANLTAWIDIDRGSLSLSESAHLQYVHILLVLFYSFFSWWQHAKLSSALICRFAFDPDWVGEQNRHAAVHPAQLFLNSRVTFETRVTFGFELQSERASESRTPGLGRIDPNAAAGDFSLYGLFLCQNTAAVGSEAKTKHGAAPRSEG